MVEIEETAERRAIVTPFLALRFRWIGDRWAHAIEVGPEGRRAVFAESWEDDPGDDPNRVSSPTYQEVTFQRDSESHVHALCVGRWGPHYFSADFSLAVSPPGVSKGGDDGANLLVSVALRSRVEDIRLGATYRMSTLEEPASPPPHTPWDHGAWAHSEERLDPRRMDSRRWPVHLAEQRPGLLWVLADAIVPLGAEPGRRFITLRHPDPNHTTLGYVWALSGPRDGAGTTER